MVSLAAHPDVQCFGWGLGRGVGLEPQVAFLKAVSAALPHTLGSR